MNFSSLRPSTGSVKVRKRVGRGAGSGLGGTSARGHKGAKSRSGYKSKKGFEGGQMPLQRRVPKFGFKNPNRVEYQAINLDTIESLVANKGITEINLKVLVECGIASKNDLIKVLGRGELKSKVNLSVNAVSASVQETVEKLGGSVVLV